MPAMLEFVNFTGDASGADVQTRRKVRSQAMRDFRRRQRASRDAAEDKQRKSTRTAPSPGLHPRSLGSDPLHERIRQDAAQSRSMSSISSQPVFSVNLLNTPRSVVQQAHQSSLENPRAASRASSPAPAQNQVRGHQFESPAQISQMLAFCTSYLQWLQPETSLDALRKGTAEAWDKCGSSMLLTACCLASVGHLDAVQPNRPSGGYAAYKAWVLGELTQRMQSPHTAVAEETIGTLACLLSFEMSKNSPEAITHLRGLANIINVRGGIGSVGSDSRLAMMIECLDIIHCCMFDTNPAVAKADAGTRSDLSDLDPALCDAKKFEQLISPLIAEQEQLQKGVRTPHSDTLAPMANILHNAGAALRSGAFENSAQDFVIFGADPVSQFRRQLDRFGQVAVNSFNEHDDTHHLARACHLTLVIFYSVAMNKGPYRHDNNQQTARMLAESVRHVKDLSWTGLPYLRVWILATGLSTSTDGSARSFLKAQLVRASYCLSTPSRWRPAKRFLLRFVDAKVSPGRSFASLMPLSDEFAACGPSNSSEVSSSMHSEFDHHCPSVGSFADTASVTGPAGLLMPAPHVFSCAQPTRSLSGSASGALPVSHQSTPSRDLDVNPFFTFTTAGQHEIVPSLCIGGDAPFDDLGENNMRS